MSQVETPAPPPAASTRPRRRRWRRWIAILFLVALFWLAVLYGIFVFSTDRDLQEAIAVAERDMPEGWQLDDIERQRAQVPDAENAALVVMKVKRLLPAAWPPSFKPGPGEKEEEDDPPTGQQPLTWMEQLQELPPERQVPEALLGKLRTSLAQVEPARAEARKLIGMTRGRYPIDYTEDVVIGTILHSPDARDAANFLRYEATLVSQEGTADDAVALARGLIGVARSVGDEPFLISVLIRYACTAQAVAVLERALAQGEPSPRELETIQALLEQEAAIPLFLAAMRGERAGMHKLMLALRSRKTSLATVTGATSPFETAVLDMTGPTLSRSSHARMFRLMNEYVEAARLLPEKQPPAMKDMNRKVIQAKMDYDIVTSILMPATGRVSEAHQRNQGTLRCAIVGVALERYRRDHGRWPDKLEGLVPKYLAAVPTDPQDGKPLRYQPRKAGVVVYWIGHDGIDNDGNLDRVNYLKLGTDQGFRLWDVEWRRQTAPEGMPPPRVRPGP